MKKVSSQRREQGKRFVISDETPLFGREAMIATIDDELKLIITLRAENEEEYSKFYLVGKNMSLRQNRIFPTTSS